MSRHRDQPGCGEPVADIVPHAPRARWLPGASIWEQLGARAADAQLTADLDELAGATLVELRPFRGS